MKKLIIAGVLFGGGATLAACISLRPRESPFVVSVSRDGDTCRAIVSGERVTSDRLNGLARLAKTRRAIVIYDEETPYKCIGATIFALQGAGMSHIDAVIWNDHHDH